MPSVPEILDFLFSKPLLKTDQICPDCKGYVSLKVNTSDQGGWVTKRCLCGTSVKYLKSGKEITVSKESYDPIHKKWRDKETGGDK